MCASSCSSSRGWRGARASKPLDRSSETARALRRALLAWYRRTARNLPWRRTRDPYCIWLSEILLQQTRVETVVPYYERFVRAFPSVAALARAPLGRVLRLWAGLGYYTRARNLHRAARIIAHEHGGRFPQTADEWRQLPGIGRYTAGAGRAPAPDWASVALWPARRADPRSEFHERLVEVPG